MNQKYIAAAGLLLALTAALPAAEPALAVSAGASSQQVSSSAADSSEAETSGAEAAENTVSSDSATADADVSGSDIIPEGVYFEDLDLGGLTVDEAEAEIDALYQEAAESRVTVTWDDQSISCRFSKLGYKWEYQDALEEAAASGKSGNLISRYKALQDLKYENIRIEPVITYRKSRVEKLVKTQIAAKDTDPVNATIDRENGEFIRTDSVDGQETDVDATVQSICDALDKGPVEDITVEGTVETTEPEITSEYLDQIQDRLGTYHTDYSSSSASRKTNISIAAERLDGTILAPGEQLSVSEAIGSRTAENGYELAPQYVDGTSQDSYGGGVCQVSTTLYNAVIRAELQVDERHPHSMVVHYVPYSSDAAIAEGSKDFKFTNNTDYPIYIAADADGETLYFSVYGKETRAENREVKFVSETISETMPEDEIKEDPDLAEGETRTEGSRHPKVVSTLTKEVYVDGELESSEVINSDTYAGTHRTIYKGTKKASSGTKEETTEEETGSSEETRSSEKTTEADETEESEKTKASEETQEPEEESSSGSSGQTEESTAG